MKKTLLTVLATAGVCYEIFGRKGQDVKNAFNWCKNKIQGLTNSAPAETAAPAQKPQQPQNNQGQKKA